MNNRLGPSTERAYFAIRRSSSTGFTDVYAAKELGRSGRILSVKVRLDTTDDDGTAAVLYVANAALTSAPDELAVYYKSASIALSASATEASLLDALSLPAAFRVADLGDLRIAANITASGGGATKLWIEILAEVWG